MKNWKVGAIATLAAIALAGCGGGSSSGNNGGGGCTASGGAASGTTAAQTVKINSDPNNAGRFDPQTTSVKAGDSVEWDWVDTSAQHSVSADDSSFDSCLQSAGAKFVATFTKAGDFKYHCSIHSAMTGDVKVT